VFGRPLVYNSCQASGKNIEIMDSINKPTRSKSLGKIPQAVQPVIDLLMEDDKWRKENKFKKDDWSFHFANCPQQCNGYDCGVHVCIHLMVNALNMKLEYVSNEMDAFRIYIFNCIMTKTLLEVEEE
jgi:Ulp1 family protease